MKNNKKKKKDGEILEFKIMKGAAVLFIGALLLLAVKGNDSEMTLSSMAHGGNGVVDDTVVCSIESTDFTESRMNVGYRQSSPVTYTVTADVNGDGTAEEYECWYSDTDIVRSVDVAEPYCEFAVRYMEKNPDDIYVTEVTFYQPMED